MAAKEDAFTTDGIRSQCYVEVGPRKACTPSAVITHRPPVAAVRDARSSGSNSGGSRQRPVASSPWEGEAGEVEGGRVLNRLLMSRLGSGALDGNASYKGGGVDFGAAEL